MRERKRRRLELQRQEAESRAEETTDDQDAPDAPDDVDVTPEDAAVSEEASVAEEAAVADDTGEAKGVPDEGEEDPTDSVIAEGALEEPDAGEAPEPEVAEAPEPEVAEAPEPEVAEAPEPEVAVEPEPVAEPEPEVAEAPDEPGQPVQEPVDLDALGRELEKSLGGGFDSASGGAAPPPPGINATPEDILGVQTQRAASEPDQPSEAAPAPRPSADVLKTAGGPAPMEEYEERAAMAKEVLRATSDQPKSTRKHQKQPGEASEVQPTGDDEEPAPENEQDVRFSEDLTISSRKKRKRFGR
jgi:hypothetical protein